MKHISCNSYEELGRVAADMIAAEIKKNPSCVLGLATGSTPLSTYKALIDDYKAGKLDFSQVRSVNLDEYCGIPTDHDQSYHYFMQENLFSHINMPEENHSVPTPGDDPEKACREYDAKIESLGGVDIQVLGIGHNGHIAFNEPSDKISNGTHIVSLTKSTIDANARFFESAEDVPTKAMSMGIGIIMRARKIILIAEGEAKKEIVERSMTGEITPMVPASLLQLHPDVTFITHF